jgi:hypothetical protein
MYLRTSSQLHSVGCSAEAYDQFDALLSDPPEDLSAGPPPRPRATADYQPLVRVVLHNCSAIMDLSPAIVDFSALCLFFELQSHVTARDLAFIQRVNRVAARVFCRAIGFD